MARSESLSVQNAWNSVSLEERLELVSRCQANGLFGSLTFMVMIGAVAYGFDAFYMLALALGGALIVHPMFSSYTWRREKPALILQYLAARSICRRYAYGFNISDLDIILLFKGEMEKLFISEEEQLDHLTHQDVTLDTPAGNVIPVWVCLLHGGVVMISEKRGGAKLEFVTPISRDLSLRASTDREGNSTGVLKITGCGPSKSKSVALTSRYPAAMYVFEKQLQRLVEEAPDPRSLLR